MTIIPQSVLTDSYILALIYLVDECSGVAKVKDLAKRIVGNTWGGPSMAILGALERNGWAKTLGYEGRRIMSGTVVVTPAGYLFRYYIDHRHETGNLTLPELYARVRALEMAIEPLARAGRKLGDNDDRNYLIAMNLNAVGISGLQAQLAAAVVDHKDSGVIYPWSPGALNNPHHTARKRKRLAK